jgi:hypothetical protein
MPEVSKQYYNHFDYLNLKALIEKDGFDKAYPIRVIVNNCSYGVFDGEIRVSERETPEGIKQTLRNQKLVNQKYLEDELTLTKEKLSS